MATAVIASKSGARPKSETAIIAFVLGVIFLLISSGSMLRVSGLISAKTTVPPQYLTQFAEAANVIGVVITSSPSLIPAAKHAPGS